MLFEYNIQSKTNIKNSVNIKKIIQPKFSILTYMIKTVRLTYSKEKNNSIAIIRLCIQRKQEYNKIMKQRRQKRKIKGNEMTFA